MFFNTIYSALMPILMFNQLAAITSLAFSEVIYSFHDADGDDGAEDAHSNLLKSVGFQVIDRLLNWLSVTKSLHTPRNVYDAECGYPRLKSDRWNVSILIFGNRALLYISFFGAS